MDVGAMELRLVFGRMTGVEDLCGMGGADRGYCSKVVLC